MSERLTGRSTGIPTTADLVGAGVLVAVPRQAAHAVGITVPVTFSTPAWTAYIGDDPDSHLPAVLDAVVEALTRSPHAESLMITGAPTASGHTAGPREQLHGEVHPGDDGSPALLLLLPGDY